MKKINFKYDGTDYELYFTRETVCTAESMGLSLEKIEELPLSQATLLVHTAFFAAHGSKISRELTDEIFSHITNKQDFIKNLGELYYKTAETIVEEPAEGDEKNIAWAMDE